ncbi:MAG: 16S rRNA (guanine(966)-N(2))-methyltransferase RsmD [Mycobacteriales bacterium]
MTRLIAGLASGRRLTVPTGRGVRPTSERAREGLFSTVEAELGGLAGAQVLDLYAGSGALGLEALSRGAARAAFVESDRRALLALRANIANAGLAGALVIPGRVADVVRGQPPFAAELALLDPPYALSAAQLAPLLSQLRARWLGEGALVAVERPSRESGFDWPAGFAPLQQRRYGEASIWYGRAAVVTA